MHNQLEAHSPTFMAERNLTRGPRVEVMLFESEKLGTEVCVESLGIKWKDGKIPLNR